MPDSHSKFLGLNPFPGCPCYINWFFYLLEFGFHKATAEELERNKLGGSKPARNGRTAAKAKAAPKHKNTEGDSNSKGDDEPKVVEKAKSGVQKFHVKGSKLQSIKAKATPKSTKTPLTAPDEPERTPAPTPPPKRIRRKSSLAPEDSEIEKLRKVIVGGFGWPFG